MAPSDTSKTATSPSSRRRLYSSRRRLVMAWGWEVSGQKVPASTARGTLIPGCNTR
ncbi:hypothetical protein [Paeniglutamicibacter gangotriensis]|uniref:Uncharacterized protein n=1 Tax=Paeniglutamicibacter gangotriensis Lz1y TaxID=1276920 RepID=M7NEU9_9MICC|nr:hypothetical protein [Paeniglutamicibacter gangotriensis]EMQ97043.1 hypothetical protein ADIAG_03562 [Paeniglutamicibacter gangotriensis Lz1y]